MTWQIIHTLASFVMLGSAFIMLAYFRERYILVERIGLGLLGGCGLLRINVIWERTASPFYDWAPTVMTAGFALFLFGRACRDWRHVWGNWMMTWQARRYLRAKGKL